MITAKFRKNDEEQQKDVLFSICDSYAEGGGVKTSDEETTCGMS